MTPASSRVQIFDIGVDVLAYEREIDKCLSSGPLAGGDLSLTAPHMAVVAAQSVRAGDCQIT